jgi:hypothetical protein
MKQEFSLRDAVFDLFWLIINTITGLRNLMFHFIETIFWLISGITKCVWCQNLQCPKYLEQLERTKKFIQRRSKAEIRKAMRR